MIDRAAYVPVFRQVADALRERIMSGSYPIGGHLPAETRLASEFGVGRDSIRQAVGILRAEGLLVVRPPYGTKVRASGEREVVRLPRGAEVIPRLPTPDEALKLDIDPLTWVVEVRFGGNAPKVYVGASVRFTTA